MSRSAPSIWERLPWDSDFFGVAIARVPQPRATAGDLASAVRWADATATDCLYFLADADDPDSVRAAEENGFSLVDVRVTLERIVAPGATAGDDADVRLATLDDLPRLASIARTSHRNTRFHRDKHFDARRADEMYAVGSSAPSRASWRAPSGLSTEAKARSDTSPHRATGRARPLASSPSMPPTGTGYGGRLVADRAALVRRRKADPHVRCHAGSRGVGAPLLRTLRICGAKRPVLVPLLVPPQVDRGIAVVVRAGRAMRVEHLTDRRGIGDAPGAVPQRRIEIAPSSMSSWTISPSRAAAAASSGRSVIAWLARIPARTSPSTFGSSPSPRGGPRRRRRGTPRLRGGCAAHVPDGMLSGTPPGRERDEPANGDQDRRQGYEANEPM